MNQTALAASAGSDARVPLGSAAAGRMRGATLEHKTFIAVDGSLRVAYGLDWHGRAVKRIGVLYIAGEGRFGIGQRIKGWRKKHGLAGYVSKLLANALIVRWLSQHRQEYLGEFQRIAEIETIAPVPTPVPVQD